MCEESKLTDPSFTVDTHGGYCTVRVADSLSVVIIHEVSSVIVEVYRNTEDDAPIETLQFSKADFEHKTDDDYEEPSSIYQINPKYINLLEEEKKRQERL